MLYTLLTKLVFVPNEEGEIAAAGLVEALPLAAAEVPVTDFGATIGKILFTFAALIALLFATFWFLRRLIQNRLQKGGGDAAIQVLEKRMISPKTMLYLVEIEGKKIVFAESHLEIRRLDATSSENPTP